MTKKPRAPMEQLREAGKEARRLLRKRGFEAKDSVLDAILKTKGSTTLPGIPVYLPHKWTIKAAQRIMYDILLMWKDECASDKARIEDTQEFFKFLVARMREQERVFEDEEKKMPALLKSLKQVPVLKEVFGPTRRKENTAAMHRFFLDSFAVAVVARSNTLTSEFVEWFLDWTQELYGLWEGPPKGAGKP